MPGMFVAKQTCMRICVIIVLLALLGAAASGSTPQPQPNISASPIERAHGLIRAGTPALAVDALSSYKPNSREAFAYHSVYGSALVQANRPYDAIEHYRLAFIYAATDVDKERILFERAETYAKMAYASEAAVCYAVFLRKFPDSGFAERAHLGIAEARYRLGEYHDAVKHYEKAGASFAARSGIPNALQALGRTEEAFKLYLSLLKTNPMDINSSPETLYSMGESFRLSGRNPDAKIYLGSIKEPPTKFRAEVGLGQIALEERRLHDAVRHFSEASGSPERVVRRQALTLRAEAYMKLGNFDDAEATLREVRNSHPYGKTYDSVLMNLARLSTVRGRPADAVPFLKELIYRRTPMPEALDELEKIILDAKDKAPAEFLQLWKSVGRWLMDASRSAALVKIARGLRSSGRPFLDLCSWLVKYGTEETKNEGRLLLADFYAELGDGATASGYLLRARAPGRDDDVRRIAAKIALLNRDERKAAEALLSLTAPREEDVLAVIGMMQSLKDVRKAAAFCEQAFQRTPGTPAAYARFADALYDAGRTDDALRYYQAATSARQAPVAAGARNAGDADREWAFYRISRLTQGEEHTRALTTIEKGKGIAARIAAADLRENSLRTKAR